MSYLSHADLGGQDGHGPVQPEAEGELFHAPWEPRALALTLAMGATGSWNIDASRSARETLPDYAALSYYQIWTAALEKLLIERGLVSVEELRSGRMQLAAGPVARVLKHDAVAAALAKGSPTERPLAGTPRFQLGDAVRTSAHVPAHHTRLPAYVRGKRGVVTQLHGAHVFADAHAQGLGEAPQWLYRVDFEATELWGGTARAGDQVSVDAWESYLEPA